MIIDALLLVNELRPTPDGTVSLEGCFNRLQADGLPFEWRMQLAIRYTVTVEDGGTSKRLRVVVVDPQGNRASFSPQSDFSLDVTQQEVSAGNATRWLAIDWPQAQFEHYGIYQFDLFIDGEHARNEQLTVSARPLR